MTATPNELAMLAKYQGKTIVFFPVRGEPTSLSPFALQKRYEVDARIVFEVTPFELRVRESENQIAPAARSA